MKVSLILATVSRVEEVGRCLRSLAGQSDLNFEVVLIDQNADERLAPLVRDASSGGLSVTRLSLLPPSLSGARNFGIAHASGDIIGFTDDDCWYEPRAIQNVRAAFLAEPTLDGVVAQWVEQSEARRMGPSSGCLSLAAWRRFRGGDASSISLFVKRDLFARLGGFDERFGIGQWFGAAEETDFVLRALTENSRFVHCPQARVHHRFASGGDGPLLPACRSARKRARGTGGIYAKHRLDALIVMRGLIAPVVVPLLRGELRQAIRGVFVSVGRFEGFMRWKLKEGI